MQGGVERAFLHAQQAFGDRLDMQGDAEAVIGAAGERFKDEQIERSEQRVGRSGHGLTPSVLPR